MYAVEVLGDRGRGPLRRNRAADHINPAAIEVVREVANDITAHTPKILTPDNVHTSDIVITMGCSNTCLK